MSDTTIKKLKETREKSRKDLDQAAKKLEGTSKSGADFAKKMGLIKSNLSDVAVELKNEVNSQMTNVESAVNSEDKVVQKTIDAKSGEKAKVDAVARETKGELDKAKSVKSGDKRFSAKKMTELLNAAEKNLGNISKEHKSDLDAGKRKREKSNKLVKDAVTRNRR